MFHYLVKDNEVIGAADSENVALPDDSWSVVSSENNIPITQAVFVNGEVVQQEQQEPQPVYMEPPVLPDWVRLEAELRNSAAWAKAYTQAEKSVKANTAYTLILTTVSITHNLNDLKFGWDRLRSTMQSQSSLEDFDTHEITFVRETLEECGFDPTDFNLAEGE